MLRCVNLDWLEVYVNEGLQEKNADFFSCKSCIVKIREYGTPQYREMFYVTTPEGRRFEIRRNPYLQSRILKPKDAHIRIPNDELYRHNPIEELRNFLYKYGYTFKGISRVDIALDFQTFENNLHPETFIKLYCKGDITKINQTNVAVFGRDTWVERAWNSIKWGSEKSPISAKLYNKSLEMKQKVDKPYIKAQWWQAKADLTKDVWRVEFSIKSHVKGYVRLDTGELFPSTLNTYDSREKCFYVFCIMADRYFDFRYLTKTRNGTLTRKDRAPKVPLFKIGDFKVYKPINIKNSEDKTRTYLLILKKLFEIYKNENYNTEDRQNVINTAVFMIENHYQDKTCKRMFEFSLIGTKLERNIYSHKFNKTTSNC